MSLEFLKSVFNENLQSRIDSFSSNQPIHSNDSRISLESGAHVESPILNRILIPESSFVGESSLTANYDTKKYDPRIARQGTLIFNKNTEKGTIFDPSLTNEQDFNLTNNNLINSKGWESLYTSEHQSLPLPSQIDVNNPFQAYNYGGNVNRGNLDIRYNSKLSDGFSLSSLFNASRGEEPYIISPIGNEGRELNKGSRELPQIRSLTDVSRISKYLFSNEGVLNTLEKNIPFTIPTIVTKVKNESETGPAELLYRTQQQYNVGNNPINILANIPRELGMHVGATPLQSGGIGNFFFDEYNKTSPIFTSINGDDGGASLNLGTRILRGLGIPVPTPVRSSVVLGDSITNTPLSDYGGTGGGGVEKISESIPDALPNTGMPFYFVDLRDNKVVQFRAYLEGINENISPNWSSTNYIGRSEPVYTYENSTRDLSFTLKVYAHTKTELKRIWAKLNRLTSMCYPQYQEDTLFNTKANQRMKPPLIKLRLGDLFGREKNELTGFLRSLTYTIPEETTWEMDKKEKVPKHVLVTVSYQVIHGNVPQLFNDDGTPYKFYGYDKEWDEELLDNSLLQNLQQ